MTDPTRRRNAEPVMGDHPERETNETQRPAPGAPPRRADMLSPMVIGGIVALVLIIAIVVLLLLL